MIAALALAAQKAAAFHADGVALGAVRAEKSVAQAVVPLGREGRSEELLLMILVMQLIFYYDFGEMATRGLYVFKHEGKLGNAPAYSLFERIKAELKDKNSVPRSFGDYAVSVNVDNLPNGVELLTLVG